MDQKYRVRKISRLLPCSANIKNPLLPSPSGISRCFSSNQPNRAIRCDSTRSRSRSSVVIGRGGLACFNWGVKVLEQHEPAKLVHTAHQTDKSYNLFMTSFSMPSIALSKSASEAFFQTSHSLICAAIN